MEQTKLYQIALSRVRGLKPHNARLLIEKMGSAEAVLKDRSLLKEHFPHLRANLLDNLYKPNLLDEAKAIAEWCERNNTDIYYLEDEGYPYRLRECLDAPIILYAKGSFRDWNNDFALSIVGTRNISHYGQQCTEKILDELAKLFPQAIITSGLAYGVDITAHRQAMLKGLPTLAVLAHGFDTIYPAVHRREAQEIVARGGALISEYPPFTKTERYHFLARNRIIAGLSSATLVIEAGAKSGSLTTAKLARDYDREVFAIPGRLGDRYSEGCNYIISSMMGALVTSAEDIVRLMGWTIEGKAISKPLDFSEPSLFDDPLTTLIRENQPIHINDLVRRTGETMSEISSKLFDLELDGVITAMPGGLYAIAR